MLEFFVVGELYLILMSEPPTLKFLALQQCLRLAPYIEDVGNARYDIVRPILTRMSARQLSQLEQANPHLMAHSDELWRDLIAKDYPDRVCPTSNFRAGYYRIQKEKESHLGAARERLKRSQRQYEAQREACAIVPITEPPRREANTKPAIVGQYNSSIMQQLARKTHSRILGRPRPVTHQPAAAPRALPRVAPFAPPSKKPKIARPPVTTSLSPPSTPAERPRRKQSSSIFIKRR